MKRIKELIQKGYLKKALKELGKLAKTGRQENEITLLLSRVNGLESESRMGVLSESEKRIRRNKISQAILDTMKDWKLEPEEEKETIKPINPMKDIFNINNINEFIRDNAGNEFAKKAKDVKQDIRDYEDEELEYQGPVGYFDLDKSKWLEISKKWHALLKEKREKSFSNREGFHKTVNELLKKGEIVKAIEKMQEAKPQAEPWELMKASMSKKDIDSFAKEITIQKIKKHLNTL